MVEMNSEKRAALARAALSGYAHGPQATTIARKRALEDLSSARSVVLVEGVSDQIAVETLAGRHGRDLAAAGVTVVPAGGASEMVKLLVQLAGDPGRSVQLAGLCDASEEPAVCEGIRTAGLGAPATREEMGSVGFFVCVEDLEDELIRASGINNAVAVVESQGDLRSFEKLQHQPAWRGQPVARQLRRFIGSGARRKLRYARLLAGSLDLARTPRPIEALLEEL